MTQRTDWIEKGSRQEKKLIEVLAQMVWNSLSHKDINSGQLLLDEILQAAPEKSLSEKTMDKLEDLGRRVKQKSRDRKKSSEVNAEQLTLF